MPTETIQQLALDNELFVKQLDSALQNSNLPPDSLRSMIQKVNKSLECDAKCLEVRQIKDLHNKWMTAKNVEDTSKTKLREAREKYFKTANGDEYYQKKISIPEYEKEIDDKIKMYQNEVDKTKYINANVLDAYTSSFTSYERIKQLHNETREKNKFLKDKLDNKLKFTNTKERKVWYKFKSIDSQKFYNKIAFWVYYIFVALWSIVELLINKSYLKINFWISLVSLLIFPYLIIYFIKFIYSAIIYIYQIS